jgi:hypothetical protein
MHFAGSPNGPSLTCEMNFNHIVSDACDRLLDKKAELSIKKIRELEKILADYERELDEFIARRL